MIVTAIGAPALFWPLGLRLTGSSFAGWTRNAIRPGMLPALVALPAWGLVQHFWPATDWVSLGLSFGAGAVVYAAALVSLAMRPDEREDLWSALRRRDA